MLKNAKKVHQKLKKEDESEINNASAGSAIKP